MLTRFSPTKIDLFSGQSCCHSRFFPVAGLHYSSISLSCFTATVIYVSGSAPSCSFDSGKSESDLILNTMHGAARALLILYR